MQALIMKFLFNKNTFMGILVLAIAGTIYFQSNKIDSLQEEIIVKDSSIVTLTSKVNKLNENIKSIQENMERQLKTINDNNQKSIEESNKLTEKLIKDSKRDMDKIFERKSSLLQSQYNKHIRINVDKWNNGE